MPLVQPRRPGLENSIPNEMNILSSQVTASVNYPDANEDGKNKVKLKSIQTSVLVRENGPKLPISHNSLFSESTPLSPPPEWSKSVVEEEVRNTPIRNGGHHKHVLDCSYSSSSADSSIGIDPKHTPPRKRSTSAAAAKRHSPKIIEHNNSKRRRTRITKESKISSIQNQASNSLPNNLLFDDDDDEHNEFSWNTRKGSSSDEESESEGMSTFLTDRDGLLSPEERNRKYWELCYGQDGPAEIPRAYRGFSSKRAPPLKGCLSSTKPRRTTASHVLCSSSTSAEDQAVQQRQKRHHHNHVQFGSPSAAEYEVDSCPLQLTPMPDEKVRHTFSMNPDESTKEEAELTLETKQNNAILSEWDDLISGSTKQRKGRDRKGTKKNRRLSSMFTAELSSRRDDIIWMDTGGEYKAEARSPTELMSDNLSTLHMSDGSPVDKSAIENDDQVQTWDFLVNLGSINSSGAACISMNEIVTGVNSSGSASRNYDRMVDLTPQRAKRETNDRTSILSEEIMISNTTASLIRHDDTQMENCKSDSEIVKSLLHEPFMDQEFPLSCVAQAVAASENSDLTTINNTLLQMDPFVADVKRCADELYQKAENSVHRASRVDNFKKSLGMDWWRQDELLFINTLIEAMTEVDDEVNKFDLAVTNAMTNERLVEGLQLEIASLENEVEEAMSEVNLTEAASAPKSAMLFNMTVFTSLFGFTLEHFSDDEFVLQWKHMEYITTSLVFRTKLHPDFTLECIQDTRTTENIRDLHMMCIGAWQDTLKKDLYMREIDYSLFKLSEKFEKLDRLFLEFHHVKQIDHFEVSIEKSNPVVTLESQCEIYRLSFDQELSLIDNAFLP